MEKMQELKDTVVEKWKELSRLAKISIILATASVIIILIFTTVMANKTNYSVLFADLSDADSGNVTKNLEERGIKYKLEDKGSKILVDSDEIDKVRIDLAVEDQLPNKSTGFEIFDQKNMMATDEDRKVMYQRAVTGELQRAIESLEAVKEAKVMLVTPNKSIFEEKNKEASASIILKLKPNQGLSEDAIKGIASLASGAVENLPQKNIKIVDEQGNVLSKVLDENKDVSSTDLAGKYQQLKDELEIKMEEKTNVLLGTLFSEDKINVAVNVDLDFDSIEKTTVTYDDPKVRSEEIHASSDGEGINQQKIEGGNIEDNVTNVIGEDGGKGKNYNHIINNELDTETTKVLNAPGVVKRVTASVLINEDLSVQEKNQIESLVQSAVGYDKDRGDKITIQGMTFGPSDLGDEDNGIANKRTAKDIFLNPFVIFIIAALIITGAIVTYLIIRNKKKEDAEFAEYEALDVSLVPVDSTESENTFTKEEEPMNYQKPKESLAIMQEETQLEDDVAVINTIDKKDQAKRYAKENPEVAADLIKVWMKDE
ncbi:flagellar M-ring protein FliF [Vagococcus sp. DIV0080]|uniref:Flagellar M-ring protein n=1 Tax=Candidatus Vagococcus giribetii TaxID=2230876 RepID=A0ABS3HTD0_9ENTE|nr:flagellar basal-body MS-ring/collar protein FliF [Vagococcus sp. DIV0080]MBO0476974.1 flagellar M-ring protein FliF [Vagococcus sp. DIV0080]